jgi:hypothetical protein
VMCIFEAWAWAETAEGGIIPLPLPSMLFFAVTEYEPICLHFSVRNRYTPRFHARIFGQRVHEHCAKCFLVTYLLVL